MFKAYDPELNRHVAIKVLPSYRPDDPTFVERFRREAQAVASLNHPNIIKIYDFGEDKGFSYILMEHITGGTLEDLLGDRLPLTRVLDLVAPLAEALESAHGQGIIHRDIKPANVLLKEDGKPILSDFGLARSLEGGAGLTKADTVMGTPEYMSPEQALGRPADQRSDLYALAILIYQMLLGRTPFRADTPSATIMAHIHEAVPLPSTVDPDVDPRLEAILLKALAKDPDDRYQTAGELLQALTSVSASAATGTELDAQATVVSPVAPPVVVGGQGQVGQTNAAGATSPPNPDPNLVDVNTATDEELEEALRGIDAAFADAIVEDCPYELSGDLHQAFSFIAQRLLDAFKGRLAITTPSPVPNSRRRRVRRRSQEQPEVVVNVNTASHEELRAVPGIEAAFAQAIAENGPYDSIGQLLNRSPLIGFQALSLLRSRLTV